MAGEQIILLNDQVRTLTVHVEDVAGHLVPAAAGDVFSVVSNNPNSLNAVMGTDAAGAPAVVLNALVQVSPDLSITISDSAGLPTVTYTVGIVDDTAPAQQVLDIVNATNTAQPVPAAPGP